MKCSKIKHFGLLSALILFMVIIGLVFEPIAVDFVSDSLGVSFAKKTKKSKTKTVRKKTYSAPKVTKFKPSSTGSKALSIPWSRKKKDKTQKVPTTVARKKTTAKTTGKAGIKPALKAKKTAAIPTSKKTASKAKTTGKAGIKPGTIKPSVKVAKKPTKSALKPTSSGTSGVKPVPKVIKKVKPTKLSSLKGSALDRQLRLRNSDKRLKQLRSKNGFGKPARLSRQTINTNNPLYRRATSHTKPVSYQGIYKTRGQYYSKYSKRKKKREIEFEFPLGNGRKLEIELGDNGIEIEIEKDDQAPVYGMYNTQYLNHSLSHWDDDPETFAFMYNNWNDPGMRAYWLEMKSQAHRNARLRSQMSQLETRIAKLDSKGAKRNLGNLPEGLPPAIALASEIIARPKTVESTEDLGNLPKVTIGTAPSGGLYNLFGVAFASYAKGFRVEAPVSQGSIDNLKGFGKKYDIIIAQSDAVDKYLRDHGSFRLGEYQFPVINEFFQAIVNKKSKIDEISDVDKNTLILPGPANGGPAASWENVKFHAANGKRLWNWDTDKYAGAKIQHSSYQAALQHILTNPGAVMLYVSGLHTPLVENINRNHGKKLRLIPFDEDRFLRAEDKEGNPVYNEQTIPSDTYPDLQKGWVFTSVDSLTVQMILAVHDSLFKKHPEIRPHVEDALAKAIMDIQKVAGYEG